RYADRGLRQIRCSFAGKLDAALDFTHIIQVIIEPGAITRTYYPSKTGDIVGNRIENTAVSLLLSLPLRDTAAVAKQALEDDLRIDFHGKGFRWRLPVNCIHIGTAIAVVANSGIADILDSQFERWQSRVLTDLACDNLVDRRAEIDI